MRGRVARRIRLLSRLSKKKPRDAKREWDETPRDRRSIESLDKMIMFFLKSKTE